MPDGKLYSMAGGWMVTKWWGQCSFWIGVLLQSWNWAVLHHGVDTQVHEAHHAGEHVNIHVTQSGVSGEPHCHYGGAHWLIRLFILSCRDTSDCPWAVFPLQASHDLCKPGQRAWRLVGVGSHVITSWGGLASSSLFSVAVGQSLLQVAIRDPLGWACVLWLLLQLGLWWGPLMQVLPAWVQLPLPN